MKEEGCGVKYLKGLIDFLKTILQGFDDIFQTQFKVIHLRITPPNHLP